MTDLAILLVCAILLGLAFAWLNIKAPVTWLKLITIFGVLASFAIAGSALFRMASTAL